MREPLIPPLALSCRIIDGWHRLAKLDERKLDLAVAIWGRRRNRMMRILPSLTWNISVIKLLYDYWTLTEDLKVNLF